ncbi:hypothetical protein P152DRAFT_416653 [Eremomyces bilateralis CBS 781.70]|uniref:Pinin/SDK/MemA protein domain-containing protein n=1 Tax=Eremomyces bilateralis CBS 781.70 TaxID=1392243 RepID=A0A6G1G3M0_9PEZI|nr:uncharacterized protein P152DRAFT_416653 [Eremomyces bilateralis CBS 781.70]KAF1812510.1 hypothetical protein P152DRAFT_416653 [Eremomyces bilateralis CBS 781.70]
MADDMPLLASAVIVPDAPNHLDTPKSEPPCSPTLKRRQSSISDTSSKRPRLSVDGDAGPRRNGRDGSEAANGLPTPTDEPDDNRLNRRRSGLEAEKGRGKRLFGALLGTLSQNSASAAQRRRADIDKKQQAKLRQQAADFDQRRKERLGDILEARKREQGKFEEQSMRVRHSNMLAMAHFLQTKTEPRLYYKPWELSAEEEDIIASQVAEVEVTIDRELEEFEARRPAEDEPQNGSHQDGVPGTKAEADLETEEPGQQNGHPLTGADHDSAEKPNDEGAEADSGEHVEFDTQQPQQVELEAVVETETKHEHDDDEEIMEGEEDTVLY